MHKLNLFDNLYLCLELGMSIYNYTWCPIFKASALWANAFYKLKFLSFKISFFFYILGAPGNHACRCIRDLWSKCISLLLAYFQTFLSFCIFEDFFSFSKKSGFGLFLVHRTVVSVLLSALVRICFVSHFYLPGFFIQLAYLRYVLNKSRNP